MAKKTNAKKKKWPGIRQKAKPKKGETKQDSYQADVIDFQKMKVIADVRGLNKSEFIRRAISQAIAAYERKHGAVKVRKRK